MEMFEVYKFVHIEVTFTSAVQFEFTAKFRDFIARKKLKIIINILQTLFFFLTLLHSIL